ncbi:DUF4126 domain-containing protein [Pseudoroseomonas wenyumeiae]|uniref:DUF4126 domain-containing protein n=1 Tax=Teichococcus wenyumeiae TaxID=2478470 RepID=A0A3A9JW44_9PROT|nr:DUF4126 domain-containing protein [Pseudoroseomonas wenyumeiae]RMI27362.1 DUF4126 domain-containing protein [Pseudoroseomonas wenyumeiae]
MFPALAFLIGVIAGLRAMVAPAALSWAAWFGWLHVSDIWLAFLGWGFMPWLLTLLALAELVLDQRPAIPSRKVPLQFGTRLVSGAICGAALMMALDLNTAHLSPGEMATEGLVAGLLGAVAGTLGGAEARAWLARRFRRDSPGALLEDAAAVLGAVGIVSAMA